MCQSNFICLKSIELSFVYKRHKSISRSSISPYYKIHFSNILFGSKYFYNLFLINFYLIRRILRLYLFKIPLHHHRPPINRVHGLEHYLLVAIMVIVISHRHQVIYCLIMIQMRIH